MNSPLVIETCLAATGFLIAAIGTWIAMNIEKLTSSIERLNERMAVVGEKVTSHEKRIERLERKRV